MTNQLLSNSGTADFRLVRVIHRMARLPFFGKLGFQIRGRKSRWLMGVLMLTGIFAGCDSRDGGSDGGGSGGGNSTICETPETTPNANAPKSVGMACNVSSECQSGWCTTDNFGTTGAQKVCAIACCNSGGGCLNIATATQGYTASIQANKCHCLPTCNTVDTCKALDSAYDTCDYPLDADGAKSGATKVCQIKSGGGGGTIGDTDTGDPGDAGADSGPGPDPVVNPTPGCYKNEDAPYPDALLPGEPCEDHSDCRYGLCATDSIINNGAFPVCIKKCGDCVGYIPACSHDDDPATNSYYTCVKQGKVSHCARRCDSDSGFAGVGACQTLAAEYNYCGDDGAGRDYCGVQ
ncbi:MAG: hypothetical protein HUU55_20225 [Myxococcales bacterium]|nr:hypothetical protein [Myxococcales bacterium]